MIWSQVFKFKSFVQNSFRIEICGFCYRTSGTEKLDSGSTVLPRQLESSVPQPENANIIVLSGAVGEVEQSDYSLGCGDGLVREEVKVKGTIGQDNLAPLAPSNTREFVYNIHICSTDSRAELTYQS